MNKKETNQAFARLVNAAGTFWTFSPRVTAVSGHRLSGLRGGKFIREEWGFFQRNLNKRTDPFV
jgi:hypothetical protein